MSNSFRRRPSGTHTKSDNPRPEVKTSGYSPKSLRDNYHKLTLLTKLHLNIHPKGVA